VSTRGFGAAGGPGPAVEELALGAFHSCARLGDGSVECWGYSYSRTPVVVQGLSGAVEIAAGDFHACAGLGDGTVKCWDLNNVGQLGDGTTMDRSSPVPVTGLP
jgi:alpha-tubulin suppressor-like RCC1 family protein